MAGCTIATISYSEDIDMEIIWSSSWNETDNPDQATVSILRRLKAPTQSDLHR